MFFLNLWGYYKLQHYALKVSFGHIYIYICAHIYRSLLKGSRRVKKSMNGSRTFCCKRYIRQIFIKLDILLKLEPLPKLLALLNAYITLNGVRGFIYYYYGLPLMSIHIIMKYHIQMVYIKRKYSQRHENLNEENISGN